VIAKVTFGKRHGEKLERLSPPAFANFMYSWVALAASVAALPHL